MLLTLSNTDKKAVIDEKNYDRVVKYTWFLKRVGPDRYYIATSIRENGKVKTLYLHRYILQPAAGMDVHHKDENIFNNLEDNLEEREAPLHRCWHLSKRRFNSKQRPVSKDV